MYRRSVALALVAALLTPTSSVGADDEERGPNTASGRRYLQERAVRDREEQQRRRLEDDEMRRRARTREQHQSEQWMERYRNEVPPPSDPNR
jgi:hypothetical protein